MGAAGGRLAATIGPGILALVGLLLVAGLLWAIVEIAFDAGALSHTARLSLSGLYFWAEFQLIVWIVRRQGLEEALLAVKPFFNHHTGLAIALGGVSLAAAWLISETFLFDPFLVEEPLEADDPVFLFDAWFVALTWIAVGCVIVPIVEEVIFRGWLQPALIDAGWRPWLAIAAVSLIFGALHPDLIAATISGLLFGYLRHKSGGLAAPIIAHALHNAVVGLAVFGREGVEAMPTLV